MVWAFCGMLLTFLALGSFVMSILAEDRGLAWRWWLLGMASAVADYLMARQYEKAFANRQEEE